MTNENNPITPSSSQINTSETITIRGFMNIADKKG